MAVRLRIPAILHSGCALSTAFFRLQHFVEDIFLNQAVNTFGAIVMTYGTDPSIYSVPNAHKSTASLFPEYSRTLSPSFALLLVTLIESHGACMISPKVVEILDFVDPNDPILAREGLV